MSKSVHLPVLRAAKSTSTGFPFLYIYRVQGRLQVPGSVTCARQRTDNAIGVGEALQAMRCGCCAACILHDNCQVQAMQAVNHCLPVLPGLKQAGHAPKTHKSTKHRETRCGGPAPHPTSKVHPSLLAVQGTPM
eukprot:1147598-Pelagomonas_calceolata.AAC.8